MGVAADQSDRGPSTRMSFGDRTGQRPNHREPPPPPREVLAHVDGRVLDPGTALTVRGVVPRSTVYVGPRLVVSVTRELDQILALLRETAASLGWDVEPDESYPPRRGHRRDHASPAGSPTSAHDPRPGGAHRGKPAGVARFTITVQSSRATIAPDGWVLLQQARARFGVDALGGVGLDHVLFVAPGTNANPHHDSNPYPDANPHHDSNSAGGDALDSYLRPGSGGRQPVAFVGPPPYRRKDSALAGRRPVVAVLDTGCGRHPWLDDIVRRDVRLDAEPIGYTDEQTDPETNPDNVGPLDGGLDQLSGHGTFIAGLVHQACPDADIIAWRVVNSAGPIVESDLVEALTRIAELVRRHAAGEPGGQPIDVLNLSMGYYHETPEDLLFDPTMYHLLELMGRCGTAVVCSAGNDATARPLFPAAFAPWANGSGVPAATDCVPVLSVGALNPDATVALFSNTGPWVRCYEPGAAVVSTMPRFQGGLEPIARTEAFGLLRESIDPDDFTGGFAVWSGTSFAAPMLAGRLAAAMCDDMPPVDTAESQTESVERVWRAVETVTSLTP